MEDADPQSVLQGAHVVGGPQIQRISKPIDAAQVRLKQEQKEIVAEIGAFEQFGERIEAIDSANAVVSAGVGRSLLTAEEEVNPLAQVRAAYRETVMDLAHYDREYGEPLRANLGAELGPDLAQGICEGTDAVFTSQFKQALLTAVHQASHERTSFRSILDEESASLTSARETLTDIVKEVNERVREAQLQETDTVLSFDDIEECIDTVVTDRQQRLHDRSQLQHVTNHDLCEYLYGDNEWTYPILAAAASLRQAVDHLRPNTTPAGQS